MQAAKAIYRNGQVQLLTPLTVCEDTELVVVVLDRDGGTGIPASSFRGVQDDSEQAFGALGMASFFDTDEDLKVDWEEVFDVKPR